jgi:two-component system phosphate regulon response regulator OmpR
MSNDALILVVDDDEPLRSRLQRYLMTNEFRVTTADGTIAARESLRILQPDLIVLDVTMPGENGLELTSSLRASGNETPILLLTARGDPDDRIAGFEAGADDYLGKPFEPKELLLRIRAMLRRANTIPPPTGAASGPVQLGALIFDPDRGELRSPTTTIRLTGGEAALLATLARRPNEILSREDIVAALDMDETGERAIDVQVTRLRRKIEVDPREPRFLHTIRGRGYTLRPGA